MFTNMSLHEHGVVKCTHRNDHHELDGAVRNQAALQLDIEQEVEHTDPQHPKAAQWVTV